MAPWSQPPDSHIREDVLHGTHVEGDAAFGVVLMQHLSTAPPTAGRLEGALSGPGLMALRDALRAYSRGRPIESRLRHSARLLCDHARHRDQRVEHLLVELKRTWWSLPEVDRVSRDASEARMLLSRVVSMCIEQFYAS